MSHVFPAICLLPLGGACFGCYCSKLEKQIEAREEAESRRINHAVRQQSEASEREALHLLRDKEQAEKAAERWAKEFELLQTKHNHMHHLLDSSERDKADIKEI